MSLNGGVRCVLSFILKRMLICHDQIIISLNPKSRYRHLRQRQFHCCDVEKLGFGNMNESGGFIVVLDLLTGAVVFLFLFSFCR